MNYQSVVFFIIGFNPGMEQQSHAYLFKGRYQAIV